MMKLSNKMLENGFITVEYENSIIKNTQILLPWQKHNGIPHSNNETTNETIS